MSSTNYETLISQLVVARKTRKLRQKDLADQMGIVRSMLSHWETCLRFPSVGNLLMWADTLGCNLVAIQPKRNPNER